MSSQKSCSSAWKLTAALGAGLFLIGAIYGGEQGPRYLRFEEVAETIRLFDGSGMPESEISNNTVWDAWIQKQDKQVRARIDRGLEDSLSNWILYGTSYTSLPRLQSAEGAVTESGELSAKAGARVRALAVALEAAPSERVRVARKLLAQNGIAKSRVVQFLSENLKRFKKEQDSYQKTLEGAAKSGDTQDVLLTRGTLYAARGLSVDTSLLPNYAVEDTLHSLAEKGVVTARKIRRIAVIGPGLDFADKRDGYDFYPLQTIQPFAVMEAVLRLGLGQADDLEIVTLDLNPSVNEHIAGVAKEARAGRGYTVQLPRDTNAGWNAAAVGYWKHFGEILGTRAKPLLVPQTLGGVTLLAVKIAPWYASRVSTLDLNIVAQTIDFAQNQRFDLVVATNVLVYYDRLQQAIAMASIAHMMSPGGILIANNALPAQHEQSLEYLGGRSVSYALEGSYGDDIVVYRRTARAQF